MLGRRRFVVGIATLTLVASGLVNSEAAHAAGRPTGAIAQVGTLPSDNDSSYLGYNWANPDEVTQYVTPKGDLAFVKHRGQNMVVETVDPRTLKPSRGQVSISLAGWPIWGGFYAGADGYTYVLVGRNNPTESDSRAVVALRRYDRYWQPAGTAAVLGGASQGYIKGIYLPFEAGAPHMTQVGNRLVVHMSRLIYGDGGVHHQANLTFEVNTTTMRASTFDAIGESAYSSHSFQQLVGSSKGALVTVDHGDAYPRGIQVGIMANYPTSRSVRTETVLPFKGAVGDNYTGARVTGLISGPQGVVILGSARSSASGKNFNAFSIYVDPATGGHRFRWLTEISGRSSTTVVEPRAAPLGSDRYAVLFDVATPAGDHLEYRLLDSAGTLLGSRAFAGLYYADITEPLRAGNTLYWVGNRRSEMRSGAPAYVYGLDVTNPAAPRIDSRAA